MRKFHIVHNKTNVERSYLPRNEAGRGLISLWKHYQKTIVNVVHYLHRNNNSRFIKLFLKWDENRGPTSLKLKAKKYAEEANLPFDQLLGVEKDRCKEKLKSAITQRDKAAVTNMPLNGQFQTRKSTILKGKFSKTESIELTSEENIKELNNVEFYRYLGIQESNLICHAATKSQLTEEYFCRLRKCLKSELNSINLITAINTWAIPAISYGFSMINWTKTDLNTIDTKTRNLMRKFHIVHNKTNVKRSYLPRNEAGRGLISLRKHYQKTIVNVVHYLHRDNNSRFIKLFLKWDGNRGPTILECYNLFSGVELSMRSFFVISLTLKAKKYAEEANLPFDQLLDVEKDRCKEKLKSAITQRDKAAVTNMPLNGQFQTHLHSDHIDKKTSLFWLKDGRLKGHTESEVFAIQDQAVKMK